MTDERYRRVGLSVYLINIYLTDEWYVTGGPVMVNDKLKCGSLSLDNCGMGYLKSCHTHVTPKVKIRVNLTLVDVC